MQSPSLSLDDLQASTSPAWLWDGARARIVWANTPGIAQLGGETLFDLIDLHFDPRNPSIARLAELCAKLERGSIQCENLTLPAGDTDIALSCDCYIHSLPDGRNGLLMVAQTNIINIADTSVMTGILEAMPIAIIVAASSGDTVFANQAATAMIALPNRESLANLFNDPITAETLIRHTLDAGTTSSVHNLATVFGEREVRITARRLEDHDTTTETLILLMLEDVTDRRALERSLTQTIQPPTVDADGPAPETDGSDAKPDGGTQLVTSPAQPPTNLSQIASAIADASEQSEQPQPASEAADLQLPELPSAVGNLLKNSDDAVVLHRQGAIFYANPAALQLLQCVDFPQLVNRSGLANKLVEQSIASYSVSATLPSHATLELSARTSKFPWHDGPMWQSKLRLVNNAQELKPDTSPTTFAKPQQSTSPVVESEKPVEPSTLSVPDGNALSTMSSQTAEARFSPDDPEFRNIVDIAADGIVTLNHDGEIVSLSAGAEALFGFRLAEVAGKSFAELLTDDSRKILKDYLAALGESGLASVFNDGREVTGIVSQGGEISLFMTISALGSSTHASYCAVLRDITQWKKTEAELRDAIHDAEASSAQKSEFLARISHELRTPLNAILGFSDVMRSERFGEIRNDKYLGYANDIHQSGTHLLSLINDLLDLSKVEAGKLELNFTSVDLAATASECTHLLQDQATAARVVVRQNIAEDLPNVVADLRSIKQILFNLLSNAIKFTDPGGQVIISAKLNAAGELVLKIKDTGIGMDAKELATALQPFSRIDTPDRTERSGTGLGLPLTRALTEANRARFSLTSARKKGTLVEITFPTTRVLAD